MTCNQEDCDEVLFEVKEEPKGYFESVEPWVENNIKQEVPKKVENGQKSSQIEVFEVDDDDIPDDFD